MTFLRRKHKMAVFPTSVGTLLPEISPASPNARYETLCEANTAAIMPPLQSAVEENYAGCKATEQHEAELYFSLSTSRRHTEANRFRIGAAKTRPVAVNTAACCNVQRNPKHNARRNMDNSGD